MLLAAAVVAIARQLWWIYLIGLRGPLGFEVLWVLCFPLVVIVLGLGLILVVLVILSIRRTRQAFPSVVLILGILVAFYIPLPEPPDTPEKLHFIAYRNDYEKVVELAQNDALIQALPDCPAGFRPPANLSHVSSAGCMFLNWHDGDGLSVHFNPIEPFYHPVVYIEFDHVDNPCGYDAYVEQRIDDHWYVCEHDWN
jgi:hypothetical protein